ncbi:hypothetical protein NM208_g17215 [Fusarium decemcellulare]|uniref:Uncharacterized protein n=1 Tax=Fusarium decemcellulare TaxID=57161 RepID=A0ACC1R802_9HYPO|nr:hypothetical protein NM208_g17215 [Fusarium decemcellulare]
MFCSRAFVLLRRSHPLLCESNFLKEPKIRVSLGGISAYVELDLSASAAVHQSVELFASPKLQIAVPGLESELGAAVALDLVVGCGAAIDLSAGVYISFADSAYVDISLLTKDVVGVSLDGLVTKALPIGVGADVDLGAGIDLQLGLRLRSELNIGAGVDIPILDIGADAGFGAAVWVSLFDYTATIAAGAGAGLSVTGDFACNLGLAVDGNLGLGGGLDFGLVPSLSVSLAKGAKATFTQKDRGTCGSFIGHFKGSGSIGGPTVSASGLLTASDLYTASAGASVVVSIPADVTASAHISGSLGGSLSLTLGLPDASASLELPHLSGSVDLPVISASVDISGSAGLPELSNSVNLPLESASAGLTLSGGLDIPDITISGGSDATAIFGSLPGDNGGHTDSVSATVSVPESAGSTTDSGSYPVKTGEHEHHDSPSKPADTSDADAVTATSDAVIATSDAVTATSDAVITQTPDASGMITSTLRETHTYTITSCAASVINCPASYTQKIVTSTIIEKVTVCPATATATAGNEGSDSGSGSGDDSGSGSSPVTTSAAEVKTTIDLATITKTLTTLKPCTKLTTSTFRRVPTRLLQSSPSL